MHVDGRILAFTAAVSLLTGLLFGLAPRPSRDACGCFRHTPGERSRYFWRRGRVNAGKVLVTAQVAISLLLLIGAGLFLRTLHNLQNVDLGYAREKLLLVRIDAVAAGYKTPQRAAIFQSLLERFRAFPACGA